jgi:hypothetical protein
MLLLSFLAGEFFGVLGLFLFLFYGVQEVDYWGGARHR